MRRSHLQHRLIAVPDPPPTPAVENMAQRPTVAAYLQDWLAGRHSGRAAWTRLDRGCPTPARSSRSVRVRHHAGVASDARAGPSEHRAA